MPPIRILILSFLLIGPLFFEAIGQETDPAIQKALADLNRIRANAGLEPVQISPELSEGCFNHAKYLARNNGHAKTAGMNAHKEFPELEGYTESGKQAGKNSVITYVLPADAVASWESTFYHRVPLLQPGLKEIGIGYYEQEGTWPVCLIDCVSKVERVSYPSIVPYPADLMNDVPVGMGPEIPHPMGKQGSYGFPITIYFARWQKVEKVKFKLLSGPDKTVPCRVSTPERPATYFHQWGSICAIPEKPLSYDKVYVYYVNCMVDGEKFSLKVKFKTEKEPN